MSDVLPGKFAVILPAAGKSLRYGSGGGAGSKLAEKLGEQTVLARAVAAFVGREDVVQIIIATSDVEGISSLLPRPLDGKVSFAAGGSCRAESVRSALRQVRAEIPYVAVHDAARPLVTQRLIDAVFKTTREEGAAAPATAVVQTIKQAHGPLPAKVERTLPRHTLWALQTPQAMRTADLRQAFELCPLSLDQITDDLQLLEFANFPAMLVAGEESNLKITYPHDLELARHHLSGLEP